MGGFVHKPVSWHREAAALWAAGQRDAAATLAIEALDANPDPEPDAFIQPGFYLFQLERFELGTQILERGVAKFPDHPMILLSLGSSYSRWHRHKLAIPSLERFLALGIVDASAFDALAMSCSGWTCRFHVDESVDATFRAVIADEGAELIMDTSGDDDVRHLLCRRFLVSDDPDVGYFMVRDCDSVVSEREAAAVTEWLESGLPFHVMRDWYTHTDPMLAGMWGGIARMFPDMAGAIARFRETTPLNTNWDQFFLRDQVWPAIRDQAMVHDRYFTVHRARPFPTASPRGEDHVGQNEYGANWAGQEAALADFAARIPALQLPRRVTLSFKLG